MTRIGRLALVGAFFIAGTTFGQAPGGTPPPIATNVPGNDASDWRPAAPGDGAPSSSYGPVPSFGPGDAGPINSPRFFGDVDYLLGWVSREQLPVLVSTSPAGTPQVAAGVLGANTSALFGGGRGKSEARSGVRANLGAYLDPAGQYAVDVGFFGLEGASNGFQASSTGTPILARPFFNATTGAQASALVAFPGLSSGSIQAAESSRTLYGANIDIRERICCVSCFRLDALLGYRFLRYDESLRVSDTILPASGPFTAGTSLTTTDRFAARNIFNGVDLGGRGEFAFDALSLVVYGKVAVGDTERTGGISGSTVTSVPGTAPLVATGGLLALASNIGTHSSHTFSAVPEIGLNLGYQLTENVRFTVGYSSLVWINVLRPASEIDTIVNPGLFPGSTQTAGTANRPAVVSRNSDLWVQAINIGLQVRY